jgi:hypothetical protein
MGPSFGVRSSVEPGFIIHKSRPNNSKLAQPTPHAITSRLDFISGSGRASSAGEGTTRAGAVGFVLA